MAVVPELLAKKRKRDEQWSAKKLAAASDSRKKSVAARKEIFKRAEKYVQEYRSQVQYGRMKFVSDAQPCVADHLHQRNAQSGRR